MAVPANAASPTSIKPCATGCFTANCLYCCIALATLPPSPPMAFSKLPCSWSKATSNPCTGPLLLTQSFKLSHLDFKPLRASPTAPVALPRAVLLLPMSTSPLSVFLPAAAPSATKRNILSICCAFSCSSTSRYRLASAITRLARCASS